jgi:hypothetical protein
MAGILAGLRADKSAENADEELLTPSIARPRIMREQMRILADGVHDSIAFLLIQAISHGASL